MLYGAFDLGRRHGSNRCSACNFPTHRNPFLPMGWERVPKTSVKSQPMPQLFPVNPWERTKDPSNKELNSRKFRNVPERPGPLLLHLYGSPCPATVGH
jgi:hypothetical protein